MCFFKTLFLSFFIGFYFLSITPMHFYAHAFDVDHPNKQVLDDCSYINLLNVGQGNFLISDSLEVKISEILTLISLNDIEFKVELISHYFPFSFNLRAPPF